MNPTQQLLFLLIQASPGTSPGALSGLTGLHRNTVSGHLKHLESEGYVTREGATRSVRLFAHAICDNSERLAHAICENKGVLAQEDVQKADGDVQKPRVHTRVHAPESAAFETLQHAAVQHVQQPVAGNPLSGVVRGDAQADLLPTAKPKTSRRKPERPIPADFQPTAKHRQLGASLGVDVDDECVRFVDHAQTNDRRARDWGAAFRTWLRNAKRFADDRKPRLPASKQPAQKYHGHEFVALLTAQREATA